MGCLSSMQADVVYENAEVLTMDAQMLEAGAVAVKDGRVMGVCRGEQVDIFCGPHTERIDLDGRALLPGFIEPHNHFAMFGTMLLGLDCSPGSNETIEDVLARIRERAGFLPPGEWITGWGFDDTLMPEQRHLTRHDLDRGAPDHPVFISHVSGHLGYVSSAVLERLGIKAGTPDPEGGAYLREADGAPSGVLAEMPALMPLYAMLPQPSVEQIMTGMRMANAIFLKQGVTSINDGGFFGTDPLVAYARSQQCGNVDLRVYFNLFGQTLDALAEAGMTLDRLGICTGSGNAMLRMGAVKLIQDGSIQAFTAALQEPYLRQPDTQGLLTIPQPQLDELVEKYHRAGFQIQIHGNGDAAIESILKAFEKALQAFPRDNHRHQVIHCQMVHEEQLARMADLGVAANFFPVHIHYWGDRHREVFIGEERAARIDPLGAAVKHGVRFSMHSDVPVTPVSPLMSLHAAVNRRTSSGAVLGADQRISVRQALEALTINAAFMTFSENEKGSIERGKLADFVVLSRNPFDVSAESLSQLAIEKTIIGGKVVYSADTVPTEGENK